MYSISISLIAFIDNGGMLSITERLFLSLMTRASISPSNVSYLFFLQNASNYYIITRIHKLYKSCFLRAKAMTQTLLWYQLARSIFTSSSTQKESDGVSPLRKILHIANHMPNIYSNNMDDKGKCRGN